MIDKGIPRTGYKVFIGDEEIGEVTTGTQSPTLKKNIGFALLKTEHATEGTEVNVQVRKRRLKAELSQHHFINDNYNYEKGIVDMKHRYIPMTETDRKEMLKAIGISSVDELI